MTDHQYGVLSFWLTTFFMIILPLWRWLSSKLDLVGEKQMRRYLDKIKEMGERQYAEKELQKMRLFNSIGAYLFCCDYIIPHLHLWHMDAVLPIAAAGCFIIAGGLSQNTTVYGVKERVKQHRKRLGLPGVPSENGR